MAIAYQNVSLEEIDSICASLGSLVKVLMDPNSVALMIGSTGEVTFTKQGTKVLSETLHSHPIEKLIVNAFNKYHMKTGEDCKLFLLLLKEMMHGVKLLLKKYDEIDVRRTLLREVDSLISFLPYLYESIRSSCAIVSDQSDGFELFSKDLEGIIKTFLDSRFSLHVSKELSSLVYRFLVDSISNWKQAGDALQYLLCHFDSFCSKALVPLYHSSIVRGFLLPQNIISPAECFSDLQCVIVWDVSPKSDQACWNVQMDSLPLQLSNFWKCVEKSLLSLKGQGISVILTPGTECENIKSLCSQYEIILVSSVAEEDISSIMFFTEVSPMRDLNDFLESKNVICIESVKSIAFGNFPYTHLEISADRNCIVRHHIVLCAHTDSLWKEYYAEFYNCLKVVKQWLDPSVYFIYYKAKHLQMKTQEEHVSTLWNVEEHLKIECDKFQRSDLRSKALHGICADQSSAFKTSALGLSFPLGLWEFTFKVSLGHVPADKQGSFQNLYQILEVALLRILCLNWNTSLHNFEGQKSYLNFHEKMKRRLVTPIVPVLSKEDQVLEILQLLQQLLKIDAIVSSK